MRLIRTMLLLSALISLSGCGNILSNDQLDLTGTSWRLVSYNGILPIEGKDMTANFDGKEISGSTSCNHYFGSYQTYGDRITIEGLGWTEMACLDPEGIMEQELEIMQLLSQARTITIVGDNLEISTTAGAKLVFGQFQN
jgi:heat shock protein HslJ